MPLRLRLKRRERRWRKRVNEVQLIRNQLTAERNRAAELAAAIAAPGSVTPPGAIAASGGGADSAFRQACVEYLVFVLTRFEERDQMLADLLRARFAQSDATRKALEAALARPGASREALTKLAAALAPPSATRVEKARAQGPVTASADYAEPSADHGGPSPNHLDAKRAADFVAYFDGPWRMRRDAIDSLQQAHLRIADLRAVSFVDADSIVEERTRYSRVQSARGTNAA